MDVYELSNYPYDEQRDILAEYNEEALQEQLGRVLDYAIELGVNVEGDWVYDPNNVNILQIQLFEELSSVIESLIAERQREAGLETSYQIDLTREYPSAVLRQHRPDEREAAHLLAQNPAYIKFSSEMNDYNPDQVYQRYFGVSNIHRGGGGPCPNNWNDPNAKCEWAQTCVAARNFVNTTYRRNIGYLRDILHDLSLTVDSVAQKNPKQAQEIYRVYNHNVRWPLQDWIGYMEAHLPGHEHAELRARQFRDYCQQKYALDARARGWNEIHLAVEDLKGYRLSDIQLMARHFGIPYDLPRDEIQLQLATTFFDNI